MKELTVHLHSGVSFLLGKARQTAVVSVASLTLLASTTSLATPISELNIFGDSLSDTGALAILNPAFCPPDPYFGCRFSDGPVWAETLAADLGVSADTAYGGGTNYAIGGQRTDQILSGQLPLFLANNGGVADPDALYVIWAGGNDYLQNDPPGTFDPVDAVANIVTAIGGLSGAGATDFLVANLPVADAWGFAFNTALAAALDALAGGVKITQFDAFGLIIDMNLNPGDYGFTNTIDPCFDGAAGTVCANPDEYLLWDAVHPTAAAHRAIAEAALDSLAVPEPTTIAIFGLGLAGLGYARRRKSAA